MNSEPSFAALGLSEQLTNLLTEIDFSTPTPIQNKVIPSILMGRDILAAAQTGTGKTASFLLPIIDILAVSPVRARFPRSLIICPTRELAEQSKQQAEIFTRAHRLKTVMLIGGVQSSRQDKDTVSGADIIIATPGRLFDYIERGYVILRGLKLVVIDEADRMLDMGFLPVIQEIFKHLPGERQTLMFSATMPQQAKQLAARFMRNPKEIAVDLPSTNAGLVDQLLIVCANEDRFDVLVHLLRQEKLERAMIFCNRKTLVNSLTRHLARQYSKVECLHGDLDQSIRQQTLAQFKQDKDRILVCSDVAARGLDIPRMSHVINFDFPANTDDYIHRIGRTGRAGQTGKAYTFLGSTDPVKNLSKLQQETRGFNHQLIKWNGSNGFDTIESLPADLSAARPSGSSPKRQSSTSRRKVSAVARRTQRPSSDITRKQQGSRGQAAPGPTTPTHQPQAMQPTRGPYSIPEETPGRPRRQAKSQSRNPAGRRLANAASSTKTYPGESSSSTSAKSSTHSTNDQQGKMDVNDLPAFLRSPEF